MREFAIKDEKDNIILTVRLINGESRIFVKEEEILTCRFVPLSIPDNELPKLEHIESINDVIDHFDHSLEGDYENEDILSKWNLTSSELAELDFFVNCSNLEAWVENDFDTRLLDYRLSFPLLEKIGKQGNLRAQMRFKEKIYHRFTSGKTQVKHYLMEAFPWYFTQPELNSLLDPRNQALMIIRGFTTQPIQGFNTQAIKIITAEGTLKDAKFLETEQDEVKEIEFILDQHCSEQVYNAIGEALSKFKNLNRLKIFDGGKYDGNYDPIQFFRKPFNNLKELTIYTPHILEKVNLPHIFPLVEKFTIPYYHFAELPKKIGDFKTLKSIEIGTFETIKGNLLERLPETFGNLENLKSLIIVNTMIKHLPDSFGKLSKLKSLNLSGNQLAQLPKSFSNLKSLENLNLSQNDFKIFPLEITELPKLRKLNFSYNNLKELPESFGNLKTLKELELRFNRLMKLPNNFGNLKNLQFLNLSVNKLTSLPRKIGDLKRLKKLAVVKNPITKFPESFQRLESLVDLNLGETSIRSIPSFLGEMDQLETISITGTFISNEEIRKFQQKFPKLDIHHF